MNNQELTGNLLKSFHLATTYLKIYPPTSQMVSATIDTLVKTLLMLLEVTPSITLSELSGKLLVNGKEPEAREIQLIGNNILKLFTQKKIQSITFRAGINRTEMTPFLTAIIQKHREEIGDFPHIALDQTMYVAVLKGEEAVVKISEMVKQSGGDIGGLIKSLRESYDIIDKIPDEPGRQRAQDHLARELARQDPAVLREIFERELPRKIEDSGLKPKLLNALSQDKIKDIFGNISLWYDQIRQAEGSDFAAVERLEKLKMFIQTVLSAPAAKQVPLQFFEELLRKGLVDQLPAWFTVEQQKPATIFEIEKILAKPAAELMERETLALLPQFVQKLCQAENNDLLGKLIEKVLENLTNPAAEIRLLAADCLVSLYEILASHARNPIITFMELPVLEAAKRETSPDVHASLVIIARKIARQNILYSEYDLATRIIEMLIQHANPDLTFDEKLRAGAASAKQTLITEILDILIADLKSDSEKRKLGSIQILAKIGEGAIPPLVRVIKESDDIRSRRIAAEALKNLGAAALHRFSEELNLGLTADEMRRVIDVLHILSTDDTVQQVSALIRYPDPAVKKDILRFLGKLNTNQAKFLIIEQLKDADPAIVSEAVRLLGEIRCEEAVPSLIDLFTGSAATYNLLGELCLALGAIGKFQAVPVLIATVNKKPFFLGRNKGEWEKVRMRAAWALSKFSGPEVREALDKAAKDRSSSVAMTAKESLKKIAENAPR